MCTQLYIKHPKYWRCAWFASNCTVMYYTTFVKAAYNSILSNMGRKNLVFKVTFPPFPRVQWQTSGGSVPSASATAAPHRERCARR